MILLDGAVKDFTSVVSVGQYSYVILCNVN